MILPDVNLLVYAYNSTAPEHVRAKEWWEDALNHDDPIGLAWPVMLGFIRILTSPQILRKPLHHHEVMDVIESWLSLDHVMSVVPGVEHLRIVRALFDKTQVAGNLTFDTHLAALAIENDADLHSNDADFSRFPRLRWYNPLA